MSSRTTVDYMVVPFDGERSTASAVVGQSVIKDSNGILVDSFLNDRPPVVPDIPEEEAELRWGAKSSFQYDLTVGDYARDDDFIVGKFNTGGGGNVTWPDDDEEEPPENIDQYIVEDLYEVAREVEEVRVTGSDGTSYVDIERIKTITFQLPEQRGPTGIIHVFWTYHLNWGDE